MHWYLELRKSFYGMFYRVKWFRGGVNDNYGNDACHNLDNIYHYEIGIYGDFSEGPEKKKNAVYWLG